ncbi:uncharacterized protein LOC114149798 [Xiphophorus couchianus]|uniref:uncharacterized protein LOC114149798 n=1 Tax=Xiphophorus couchianus TaxID=32473 RepID=UPI0010161D41|nr:uncharacterized protein LOC114149798 [Xiphophorus couchianus]
MGGLGLPCFQHYYWAANARALVYWQEGDAQELSANSPPWVAIERSGVTDSSLPALLFAAPISPAISGVNNLIVLNSLKIWKQIKLHCKLPETSVHAPVYCNHAFPPSLSDTSFKNWRLKGLNTLKNLYINKKFASFAMLKSYFSLPDTDFFRYLQVRNYVRTNIPNFISLMEENKLCKILLGSPGSKKLITSFVDVFAERINFTTDSLRSAWEGELGLRIGSEVWEEGLGRIRTCSINVYGCALVPDPQIALFGHSPSLRNCSISMQTTVVYGMVIAKKVILRLWKTDKVPQFKMWLSNFTEIIHLEKLRYVVGFSNKFCSIWQPVLDYLSRSKVDPNTRSVS